jgi:hypothetical protein
MRPLACLLLASALARAADLSAIDRRIAALPEFTAERQFYALLVLGPEARARVWFVVDGERLFVDRDGDGDLTDDGAPAHADATRDANGFISLSRSWKVGTLPVSPRYAEVEAHFALVNPAWRPEPTASNRKFMERYMSAAAKTPDANSSFIWLKVDGKRLQVGSGMFARSPEAAPVIHVDGPLTLGVIEPLVPAMLERGPHPADFRLFVGTPGLGCFATIGYDELPPEARPQVEVEFPAKEPGKYLPSRRFTLDGKC